LHQKTQKFKLERIKLSLIDFIILKDRTKEEIFNKFPNCEEQLKRLLEDGFIFEYELNKFRYIG